MSYYYSLECLCRIISNQYIDIDSFVCQQPFPGMMPYKRPAADKSGVPVYQPNATTYQQLMQLQQPFVPVSCEYSAPQTPLSITTSCVSSAAASSSSHPEPAVTTVVAQQPSRESPPTSAPPPNPLPPTAAMDPATLAKEVAQQNYAKAVKLAAVSQSIAVNQFNQLNPLSYTGVALNKQALAVSQGPAMARYAALPFGLGGAGLNLGIPNPYSLAAHQQNLINMSRPPPTMINPYSLMRSPYPAAAGTSPLLSSGLLGAQYPVTVSAAPITNNVSATGTISAAAVQNNNNVVMQPYKKLKTT